MGCSVGKQRKESGGRLEVLLRAVSNWMELSLSGGGTPVSWPSVGGEGRGPNRAVANMGFAAVHCHSDEIPMSLWICSSKNILASGYQRRIYRYLRDMSDTKLHARTKVVLLRHKLERPPSLC